MIGQTISHYKITDKLGEGGMGVVYKAEDTKLNRPVAIKFLSSGDAPDDISHQRFEQEAKSAAGLSHSNICTIYGYDEHEGRPFLAMEYLEGETLREKLENGTLSTKQAINYARQIAKALSAAHEQSIVHRDIKPSNIMVEGSGQVKVMDFGLAKLEDAAGLTQTGSTVGTMAYMSPEQIKGEPVDRRSDIFALSVVLYEMLAGATPFRGEHQAAMTYAIVNEEPAPLADYRLDAPEPLEQIIRKCLAKDPDQRPGDVSEVISLLEKAGEKVELPAGESPAKTSLSSPSEKESGNGSSITIPLPNLNFDKTSVGGTRLLIGAAAMIGLLMLGSWWFVGNGAVENYEETPQGKAGKKTSVAVLPFEDISPKDDHQWFSDGLTEEILNSLARLPELRVPARSSSFLFRHTKLPAPEVADSLNVTHLVEGSVRRANNQMRITAQLIRAKDGSHIWSNTYDASTDSVFKVQQDIAEQIASALDIYLDEEQRKQMFAFGTRNVKAYEAYLKGSEIYHNAHEKWQLKQLWDANKWFERAYRLDSTFGAPYFKHSDLYTHTLTGDLQNSVDTISLEKAYNQMRSDLNNAIQHAEDPEVQLLYRFAREFLSPSWNQLPELVHQIKNNVEVQNTYARRGTGWIEMLPALGYAVLGHQLQVLRIKQDPLDNIAKFYNANALNSLGEKEQALRVLDSLSTPPPFVRAVLITHANTKNVNKVRDIWADITPSETLRPGMAKGWRLMVGIDKMNREELNSYVQQQDSSRATIFVSFAAGFPDIANQIARKIDAQILGPSNLILLMNQMGSHIPFALDATPNLKRQFNEAHIQTKTDTLFGREVQRIVQKNKI